ncbi:MAG: efflux RND transporter permease subunit, partial [Lentisphaerae bacterium]
VWKLILSIVVVAGFVLMIKVSWWLGIMVMAAALWHLFQDRLGQQQRAMILRLANYAVAFIVGLILTEHWLPLGPGRSFFLNAIVVMVPIFGLLGFFILFCRWYGRILRWCLRHRYTFLAIPLAITLWGVVAWLGIPRLTRWLPEGIRNSRPYQDLAAVFPGLGKEFMPPLDEGSYLYMPTTMPHASIGEVHDVLRKQDIAFNAIPEVESAVGKLGRAETPLDPAPIAMIETIINYKPEYVVDKAGNRLRFKFDPQHPDWMRDVEGNKLNAPDGKPYKVPGTYIRDAHGKLIPDPDGVPFRNWRLPLDPSLNPGRKAWTGVRNPNDIWDLIVDAAKIPGTTSAPKLQPIAARIVMLQSGMRAPMGIKIKGPDLKTIEAYALKLEHALKTGNIPGVEPAAVIADRVVGKPYLEIRIDRRAAARFGVHVKTIQEVIETAIGGKALTMTVEGRERYPVRVRYLRELRDNLEEIGRILVPNRRGQQIPLQQLASIEYVRGPQVIKSEDTRLVAYVLFDKKPGFAEVDVVENAQAYLKRLEASGQLKRPAGVTWEFAGNYENQIRAARKLAIVLPLALFIIFMILYFQFKSIPTTLLVFSGIVVAWGGGFVLLWLYGQDWFMNFSTFAINWRELFQIHPVNLSVAIWVGFLALFGIASDNGVVIATYLDQNFERSHPTNIEQIRNATVEAAVRRIRPCMMTSATTILALLPVLTSTGRGSDIMLPMAIPSFGGMMVVLINVFVVPVLYCWLKERAAARHE